jgi:hypothetical protein
VPYEGLNTAIDKDAWRRLGSPPVPALVVDGVARSITHPLEAAALLGVAADDEPDALVLASDIEALLDIWIEYVHRTSRTAWLEPTPSAERTSHHLALNSFDPIPLLSEAWYVASFPWGTTDWPPPLGARAHQRGLNERYREFDAFVGFLEERRSGWQKFVKREGAALDRDASSRMIDMARGAPISYTRLLEMQRLHVAHHFRQVAVFLASHNHDVPSFDPEALGIVLPEQVY